MKKACITLILALAALSAPGQDYPSQRPAPADRLFVSRAVEAEIVKVRSILLNLSKTSGIDERTMRMRAEAYVEEHEGVFVKFDDMTLEQLIALKVNYTQAFKDADQAS